MFVSAAILPQRDTLAIFTIHDIHFVSAEPLTAYIVTHVKAHKLLVLRFSCIIVSTALST
jgi:hypothetical protein